LNKKRGITIKSISILGSGWLGIPLAEHFVMMGNCVKASTTSESRLSELKSIKVEPFIIDIGKLSSNIQTFLQANVLIINIPSKNIDGFSNLIKEIEKSEIERVLFVSSTSVYENKNKTISESDGVESTLSPLLTIENLFRNSAKIKCTIVRFGGLIGYSRNPGKFFCNGRPVHNPDSNVNLIHRDDCIEIISQIVEQEVWGEVFNCCADTHPTKREFYTQAAKSIGVPPPEFVNSGSNSFKIINNQKVKQILNYEFLHPDLMKIKFEKSI
jgi:nucleoside-diphosphate-sugar epimerase